MTLDAGIYLHIPFCVQKCAYCDFYSFADPGLQPAFVAALLEEIRLRAKPQTVCDTLYLGGGTPSLLETDAIRQIMEMVRGNFRLTDDAEVTIEANPATLSLEKIIALRRMGINRINIGVQSFKESDLIFLGRCHTAEDAKESIADARKAGFTRIGLDLIYGLPGQTEAMWREELLSAISFGPEHISCYMLTYEAGTPMDLSRQKGVFTSLEADMVARLFDITGAFLRGNGYDHYEISNFARKDPHEDFRSRHNRKYWNLAPYFGFGPSAHSFEPPVRSWNQRDLHAYITALSQKQPPPAESEELSIFQQRLEAIYLGLRQSAGIDPAAFEKRFGTNLITTNQALLKRLHAEQMVTCDTTLALTLKGMRFIDSIVPLID